MKKSLLALASFAAMTSAAWAQSSVTLFGIVDLAARQVKNGSAGSQKALSSGGNGTSRFGLRGVEDLGGGLSAAFHLEAAVNPDVGTAQADKFWGRRSTVSLRGRFGELRLGRDYTPNAYNTFGDEFGVVGVGSVGIFTYGSGSNLGSPATTVLRTDNGITYFLPDNLGGVYGSVQITAGEGVVGNKHAGGRLGYAGGPIDVSASVGKTELTGATPDFKVSNVAFNYNFGFAKLHTFYDVKDWTPRKQKVASIGVSVPMGQGEIRAGYAKADRSGGAVGSGFGDADDSTRLGIGYVYALSKRTVMYGTYGRVTNDGAANSTVVYAPVAGMLGGQTSTGFEVGLRHAF